MPRRTPSSKHLARAEKLAASGDPAGARKAATHALRASPDHPGAHFLLGTLAGEAGDLEEAVVHLERAGGELGVRYNLANAYRELRRLPEALAVYEEVAQRAGEWAPAHYGLGVVHRALGDRPAAERAFRLCVAHDSEFSLAWVQLSELSLASGRISAAMSEASRAVAADPRVARSQQRLGLLHAFYGSPTIAQAALKSAISLDPEDAFARHILRAISGEHVDRPPDAYVTSLFDAYADTFDAHLVEVLGYQGPGLVAAAVAELEGPFERVADLGCGTGLSGLAVRDRCGVLVGLDLSPGMLDQARARGVYDHLVEGPIEDLRGQYDLILAVDVFVYVGDFEPVFRFLKAQVVPGGHVVFTTEFGDPGLRLQAHGRYSHGSNWVRAVCERVGCEVLSEQTVNLRKERDDWVRGQVWVTRWS